MVLPPQLRRDLRSALHAIISDGGGFGGEGSRCVAAEGPGVDDDARDDETKWSLGKQLATRQTVELAAVQEEVARRGVACSAEALARFLTEGGVAHQVPWRSS